jgi:hypothetical protein
MRDASHLVALATASLGLSASYGGLTYDARRLPPRDHFTNEKPLTKRQRRRLRGSHRHD